MSDDLLDRALAAARMFAGDPFAIRKCKLSRDDYDLSIELLAKRMQLPKESFPAAYRRAFESKDGMALYAAREAMPAVIKTESDYEPPTPAMIAIEKGADAYRSEQFEKDRKLTKERALIEWLSINPRYYELYEQEQRDRLNQL